MWLNCDRKSSFFVLECFLISEAASLILDCCMHTKLPYSQYVSYSFDCIKLNDTLVSSTYIDQQSCIVLITDGSCWWMYLLPYSWKALTLLLMWPLWLNCDKKSSFFVLECLISEAASLILDCCVRTKLPYSHYVSYIFDCIKLNDTLVSSTFVDQ